MKKTRRQFKARKKEQCISCRCSLARGAAVVQYEPEKQWKFSNANGEHGLLLQCLACEQLTNFLTDNAFDMTSDLSELANKADRNNPMVRGYLIRIIAKNIHYAEQELRTGDVHLGLEWIEQADWEVK